MAEPEATSSHVVIDITEDASADGGCCAVCMEPAEWVAVGRCGHREVCVVCAARIRFFQNDTRCCICRAHCPTVVITKAKGGDGGGGYYGYHRGMRAYFQDRGQHEAMKKMCVRSVEVNVDGAVTAPSASDTNDEANNGGAPPPQPANLNRSAPSQSASTADVDDLRRQPQNNRICVCVVSWITHLTFILLTMEFFGAFYALAENTFQKVLAVLAFVLVSVGFTFCFISERNSCRSLPNTSEA